MSERGLLTVKREPPPDDEDPEFLYSHNCLSNQVTIIILFNWFLSLLVCNVLSQASASLPAYKV